MESWDYPGYPMLNKNVIQKASVSYTPLVNEYYCSFLDQLTVITLSTGVSVATPVLIIYSFSFCLVWMETNVSCILNNIIINSHWSRINNGPITSISTPTRTCPQLALYPAVAPITIYMNPNIIDDSLCLMLTPLNKEAWMVRSWRMF